MSEPDSRGLTRRQFLALSIAGASLAGASIPLHAEVAGKSSGGRMQYRSLGRTGQQVSIVGIGGAHLGMTADEAVAIRIVRTAIDHGVNFMDNCWDYSDGMCEERMGKALREGYRQKVFLMTKIDGRDRKTAARQIDECLRRLQTDRIDLIQFHEVIRMSDPEKIFGPGGAMEAALAAKRDGKVRFIGFTGHKSPEIHLHMLRVAAQHQFRFDAVQMPLNAMDAHYDSFERLVLPELTKDQIGVLAMKPMGGGFILRSGAITPVQCLQYAMNLPVSVVITGCDSMPVLEQALRTARDFQPLAKEQVAALLSATAQYAAAGKYEKYKTTQMFDGTTQHPEWMG
jgi:predicted aldo/keto reductase-like oxidoreductase